MKFGSGVSPLLGAVLAASAALHGQNQQTGNVVHYTTSIDNVKYLFATAEPVARLKPGDILDIARFTRRL